MLDDKRDVKWVVNDNGELGVMVHGRAFFLYKGESMEYEAGQHDDGTPMLYRAVGKREFGECCMPRDYWYQSGEPRYPGRYREGEGWTQLPAAPAVADGAAPREADHWALPQDFIWEVEDGRWIVRRVRPVGKWLTGNGWPPDIGVLIDRRNAEDPPPPVPACAPAHVEPTAGDHERMGEREAIARVMRLRSRVSVLERELREHVPALEAERDELRAKVERLEQELAAANRREDAALRHIVDLERR